MAKRVFDLRGVPDEEAQEVTRLLLKSGIKYYETPRGIQFGVGAIFVDDDNYIKARQVINIYQHELRDKVKKEYKDKKQNVSSLLNKKFILFLFIVIIVIVFGMIPVGY